MFSPVSPFHFVGTATSSDVPSPRGPRQHGQSSALVEAICNRHNSDKLKNLSIFWCPLITARWIMSARRLRLNRSTGHGQRDGIETSCRSLSFTGYVTGNEGQLPSPFEVNCSILCYDESASQYFDSYCFTTASQQSDQTVVFVVCSFC